MKLNHIKCWKSISEERKGPAKSNRKQSTTQIAVLRESVERLRMTFTARLNFLFAETRGNSVDLIKLFPCLLTRYME